MFCNVPEDGTMVLEHAAVLQWGLLFNKTVGGLLRVRIIKNHATFYRKLFEKILKIVQLI